MTGLVNIIVPNLGESVTQAVVIKWLKKVGDFVSLDETILELETEKVSVEVNATHAGRLSALRFEVGTTVKVGDIIATVDTDATLPEATSVKPDISAQKISTNQSSGTQKILDPAVTVQGAPGVLVQSQQQTRSDPKTIDPDQSSRDKLSPAVRKLVAEKSIDPHNVQGSGKAGRILKGDIVKDDGNDDNSARPNVPQSGESAKQSGQLNPAQINGVKVNHDEQRLPMSVLRKTIARRLKEAQNTAALLTTFNEVDMAALIQKRQLYKDSFEKKYQVKLGYMSFFVKAAVVALKEFPALNASIDQGDIIYKNHYDIGIAVATPNGLVVPVVKGADHRDFASIEKKIAELAEKGRNMALALDEISGGTFTITNGGVFGSLLSTPIINPPQSAILGLHKIQDRPIAVDGQVVIRPMMYLALTYDHRLIDGKEAVNFLIRIKECIEDPDRILLAV